MPNDRKNTRFKFKSYQFPVYNIIHMENKHAKHWQINTCHGNTKAHLFSPTYVFLRCHDLAPAWTAGRR